MKHTIICMLIITMIAITMIANTEKHNDTNVALMVKITTDDDYGKRLSEVVYEYVTLHIQDKTIVQNAHIDIAKQGWEQLIVIDIHKENDVLILCLKAYVRANMSEADKRILDASSLTFSTLYASEAMLFTKRYIATDFTGGENKILSNLDKMVADINILISDEDF